MHGAKVGGVLSSRSLQHCINIIKAFSVNRGDFTFVKQVVLVNGLCLETKQKWLTSLNDTKLVSPVSNRSGFLNLDYSVFQEILLTDKM